MNPMLETKDAFFFQQSNAVTRIYSTDNSVLYLTFSFLVRPRPLLKALGGALT